MIALDTNCLLRRILKDDLAQLAKVDVLFALPEKILITDVVLVETVWAMKSFLVPKPNRQDIYDMVRALFDDIKIEFENKQVVWEALHDFLRAPWSTGKNKSQADFANALIINKANHVMSAQNPPANKGIYTFDSGALMLNNTIEPSGN